MGILSNFPGRFEEVSSARRSCTGIGKEYAEKGATDGGDNDDGDDCSDDGWWWWQRLVVVLSGRVSGMQSNTPINRGTGMRISEDRNRMNCDCTTLPDSTTLIQIGSGTLIHQPKIHKLSFPVIQKHRVQT